MSGSSIKRPRAKSIFAAHVCLGASMVLIVLMGVWGAFREIQLVHSTHMNAELAELRAQATRRAGHIETGLANEVTGEAIDWETTCDAGWLGGYWSGVKIEREGQVYAAIVDPGGHVRLHTNPEVQNASLGSRWYERVVHEAGEDVVETQGKVLASGQSVYDIRVPILLEGREVASYHEGLSTAWLDGQVNAFHGQIIQRWALVIGGILLVASLAFVSLLLIVRRKSQIQRTADLAEMRRVVEIGQLAAGLAHEIRNPLHAIRLNLHAFRKVQRGQAQLSDNEMSAMIEQSYNEIGRLDHLMNELLGFASPQEARNETIELRSEVKATLDFINQELVDKELQVTTDLPNIPLCVKMDPARFRQVLLNLLVNAQDAVDAGGHIRVALSQHSNYAEMTVSDDGPGIDPVEAERIFDPFYSTKDSGSGLGLALVKRFVEEAGGTINCEANGHGATFRVSLPSLPIKRR